MRVVTVRRVKMVTAGMLLSVFFLSGAVADCQTAALSIITPKQLKALSGSCLQITCVTSKQFNNKVKLFGVWIKNTSRYGSKPENVIFNSSKENNIYPMRMTGDLNRGRCTTSFSHLITNYTDTYYFRIDGPSFRATASCDPLHITVSDSPPRPRIEISGDVDVNDLKEKQSVTITCSASTPCPHSPPELTWTLQQNPQNIREQNTDGTFTTKIQETITLSDTHDGLTISCSAGYPVDEGRDVKTAAGEITLSVSYAPRDTLAIASPSGLVSAGTLVNLTCSSRAKPPISSFTWFRNSTDGATNVFEGYFYRLNVTDGGDYYCLATNNLGSQRSPWINIAGSSDSALKWGSALGAIAVIICLVICFWWFQSRRHTPQQPQSPNVEELTGEIPAREREDIHYGEISFSKRRPEPSSSSKQDTGQQQETLYGQVKVSKTVNAPDVQEDLYAQVKKIRSPETGP